MELRVALAQRRDFPPRLVGTGQPAALPNRALRTALPARPSGRAAQMMRVGENPPGHRTQLGAPDCCPVRCCPVRRCRAARRTQARRTRLRQYRQPSSPVPRTGAPSQGPPPGTPGSRACVPARREKVREIHRPSQPKLLNVWLNFIEPRPGPERHAQPLPSRQAQPEWAARPAAAVARPAFKFACCHHILCVCGPPPFPGGSHSGHAPPPDAVSGRD